MNKLDYFTLTHLHASRWQPPAQVRAPSPPSIQFFRTADDCFEFSFPGAYTGSPQKVPFKAGDTLLEHNGRIWMVSPKHPDTAKLAADLSEPTALFAFDEIRIKIGGGYICDEGEVKFRFPIQTRNGSYFVGAGRDAATVGPLDLLLVRSNRAWTHKAPPLPCPRGISLSKLRKEDYRLSYPAMQEMERAGIELEAWVSADPVTISALDRGPMILGAHQSAFGWDSRLITGGDAVLFFGDKIPDPAAYTAGGYRRRFSEVTEKRRLVLIARGRKLTETVLCDWVTKTWDQCKGLSTQDWAPPSDSGRRRW